MAPAAPVENLRSVKVATPLTVFTVGVPPRVAVPEVIDAVTGTPVVERVAPAGLNSWIFG